MDERMQETEVREYTFDDDGRIPNNPTLPLLVYSQALAKSDLDPSRCKELFAENGWGGAWVDYCFRGNGERGTAMTDVRVRSEGLTSEGEV